MDLVPINCINESFMSERLAHYEVRGKLGEGGFGQVFSAWDTKLHRMVAIKKIKPCATNANTFSLTREARMAASLKHSAFVKIYGIEGDDEGKAIIMELVPGLTLREWIRVSPKDKKKSLGIISQIAEAMHEAHSSGLIHGDLKPSNLIIEPSGKVRILDFGLAIKVDPQATVDLEKNGLKGTIGYMSPERLKGCRSDVQSDIYALGIVLFEMITGNRLAKDLNELSLVGLSMNDSTNKLLRRLNIPHGITQLIQRMTGPSFDTRFKTMQQVYEQIAALDTPLHVRPQVRLFKTALYQAKTLVTKDSRRLLISLLISVSLILWNLFPHLPDIISTLQPYSEFAELKQGFNALKIFDHKNKIDIAEAHFNKVIKNNVQSAAAIAGLSIVYRFRYLTDQQDESWIRKASASAQQALLMNNQLALSHIAMGSAYNLQGNYEAALANTNNAMKLDPNNFFGWLWHASSLRKLKRFEQAHEFLELAIIRFPDERLLMDELGEMFVDQENWSKAEQAFRKSTQLDPNSSGSYINLVAVLTRLDMIDEALTVAQEGLQIQSSGALQGNLGFLLFQKGDYVGAVAAFENAVSADKGNPNLYNQWANLADTLLLFPGNENRADEAYLNARALLAIKLEKQPNDGFLISQYAVYSARLREIDIAKQSIAKAIKASPQSPDVHFAAALVYELFHDTDTALTALALAYEMGYPKSIIETEPTFFELRREEGYKKIMQGHFNNNKIE